MPQLRQRKLDYLSLVLSSILNRVLPRRKASDKRRTRMVQRLGLMNGLPQKVGQLLAFSEIEGSDPAFLRLTEWEMSTFYEEDRERIEVQLSAPFSSIFCKFSDHCYSASIGRVYRAALLDGREVAVKVQHSGIAEAIEQDMRVFGWMTAPFGSFNKGFNVDSYKGEIGNSLRREVNYCIEAKNTMEFARCAKSFSRSIRVPKVHRNLCSETVFVCDWIKGDTLSEAIRWPKALREELSTILLRLFLTGTLDWGLLHSDPHPGNYRFIRDPMGVSVGLLDFGCVCRLDVPLRKAVWRFLSEGLSGTIGADESFEWFVKMGFDCSSLKLMKDKLASVASILLEPFQSEQSFDVRNWRLSERLSGVLGEHRMAFRMAGPSEMLFFLRAFQGLISYLKLLDTPIAWRPHVNAVLSDVEWGACERMITQNNDYSKMLSESLGIHVEENGETKASLVFGAAAAEHLPDLVPQDLRSSLLDKDIDLIAIARRAKLSNFAPGELFSFEKDGKTARVWLD